MIIPNLFSLVASIVVLYLFFRKDIPKSYDVSELASPTSAIKNMRLFRLSWLLLSLLLIGYFVSEWIQVPVSFIAGLIAIAFLIVGQQSSGG